MWRFLLNSAVVGVGATLLALILGLPAAYGIARYNSSGWLWRSWWRASCPASATWCPGSSCSRSVKMIGTYPALILAHLMITLPMTIWLMIGFFEDIPKELDEAALIDGCSIFQAFRKISLPLTKPGHRCQRHPELHLLVEQLHVLAGAGEPGHAAAARGRLFVHFVHPGGLGRPQRRRHHRHPARADHDPVRPEAHGARVDAGVGERSNFQSPKSQYPIPNPQYPKKEKRPNEEVRPLV